MIVKMLTGLSGPRINLVAGDLYDTDDAEGIRLKLSGAACDPEEEQVERAVIKKPSEKATKGRSDRVALKRAR